MRYCLLSLTIQFLFVWRTIVTFVVDEVDTDNYDHILKTYDFVFLNFYAEWCHFSRALEPIFEEFAQEANRELTNTSVNRLFIGRLNYNRNEKLANSLSVSKFPTFKLYRYGLMARNEYRGARTAEKLMEYIRLQLSDPVKTLSPDSPPPSTSPYVLITYANPPPMDILKEFTRAATVLRDDCPFFAMTVTTMNDSSPSYRIDFVKNRGENVVPFTQPIDELLKEASVHCIPLVRRLTFDNAEQMTDEGKQLLVLFHKEEDGNSLRLYEQILASNELVGFKQSLNFLHADGVLFKHPLSHLGKSVDDLPIIVIDSFQHMYVIPDMNYINDSNKFRGWIEKFQSGKLHQELHLKIMSKLLGGIPLHIDHIEFEVAQAQTTSPSAPIKKQEKPTKVPDSVFSQLLPSKERYSFTRDEL